MLSATGDETDGRLAIVGNRSLLRSLLPLFSPLQSREILLLLLFVLSQEDSNDEEQERGRRETCTDISPDRDAVDEGSEDLFEAVGMKVGRDSSCERFLPTRCVLERRRAETDESEPKFDGGLRRAVLTSGHPCLEVDPVNVSEFRPQNHKLCLFRFSGSPSSRSLLHVFFLLAFLFFGRPPRRNCVFPSESGDDIRSAVEKALLPTRSISESAGLGMASIPASTTELQYRPAFLRPVNFPARTDHRPVF